MYCSHVNFVKRYFRESRRGAPGLARSISVGIPPDVEATLDRNTGFSHGQAVPEADRGENKEKIGLRKLFSFPAIPIQDEENDQVSALPNQFA